MHEQKHAIDISAASIIKVIVLVLVVLFLNKIQDVLIGVFVAIMISSAVNPFANWMQERKIPRVVSVIFLYVLLFVLVMLLLSLAVPIVLEELGNLVDVLPNLVSRFSAAIESAQESSKYSIFFSDIESSLQKVSNFFNVENQTIFDILVKIFGGVLSFIAAIVISFYLSMVPDGLVNFIRAVIPDQYEAYVIRLWKQSERKVGKWLQGQLLLALVVGLLVFFGLALLDVKYALVLAIIATIFELVPVAGPVIASIPAIFLAFAQSPWLWLWVIVLYGLIQFIESNFLTPLIIGKSTGLHPIIVIIALLIGGTLKGIVGILIAVPLAVVVVEILEDLAEEREKRKAVVEKNKLL